MSRLFTWAIRVAAISAIVISALGFPSAPVAHAATRIVLNANNSGAGSLRDTIAIANSGDTITFDPSLNGQTITLTTGELAITKTLTITGPGAALLAVSGNNTSRVISVAAGVTVSISGLTLRNGAVGVVGGVGGGIANEGTLTITDSTLMNNTATYGGGVSNDGMLTIIRSALSGNTATDAGGGISNSGTLTVQTSTFLNNQVTFGSGGGLVNLNTLILQNSTFSGNTAPNGGGLHNDASGTANLTNVLLVKGATGENCQNLGAPTGSYNMADDNSCGGTFTQKTTGEINLGTITGNPAYFPLQAGSAAIDAGTNAACPSPDQRGALRPQGMACDIGAYEYAPPSNADVTLTKSVTPASVAPGQPITYTLTFSNTGDLTATGAVITDIVPISVTSPSFVNSGATITRSVGTTYVWEVQDLAPGAGGVITITGIVSPSLTAGQVFTNTATISTTANDGNTGNNTGSAGVTVTCPPVVAVTTTADSGLGSLRNALTKVCTGGTINFSVTTPATLTLTSGELPITRSMTITGPGASSLAVSGNNASRVFNVSAGVNAVIAGVTITKGSTPGAACPASCGAGVYNAGTLTLTNTVVSGNISGFYSGGIHNLAGAVLTVRNSTFTGNTAGGGSGITNFGGTLTVDNSTFANNTTVFSNQNAEGGGIRNQSGAAVLTNVTFSGNQVTGSNGRGGSGVFVFDGTVTLVNCTVVGNTTTSTLGAGGVSQRSPATVILRNTIVAGNTSASNKPDVSGALVSGSNNLIGSTDGSTGITNGVNGDIAGTNAAPVNPQVGALGSYGGSTQTRPLLPGSLAINRGNNAFCPALDQRGVARVGTCDIGAYEYTGALYSVYLPLIRR